MPQKFLIQTDKTEVEKAVQQIEQDFAFRAVQTIKSLQLSPAEEQVVLEVSRVGRCPETRLLEFLRNQGSVSDPASLIRAMVEKTYLVQLPTAIEISYALSFSLQPPKPLSPELAHSINNQINSEGGVTVSYVRQIYTSLGEPGVKIISDVMSEQGRKYATALAEVRGGGPQVVGRRFIELMQVNGAELVITESSQQTLVYRQHRCPYKLVYGETKLCNAVNSFDQSLLNELGCQIRYTQRTVEGADYCEAVIERLEQ